MPGEKELEEPPGSIRRNHPSSELLEVIESLDVFLGADVSIKGQSLAPNPVLKLLAAVVGPTYRTHISYIPLAQTHQPSLQM